MGKWIGSFFGIVIGIVLLIVAAQFLGVVDLVRQSILTGHLLDWLTGVFCLLWLMVILKAPWDLYFKAYAVAFEQQRSRERGLRLEAGRENYVQTVRRRLLFFAIGAHAVSAAVIAVVTFFTEGTVGYWFAGFYLLSTLFRPVVAGYSYLWERLKAIGDESRYPRDDVEEMRQRLNRAETNLNQYRDELRGSERTVTELRDALRNVQLEKEREVNDLHNRLTGLSHEFERTIARLTDNQEVIKGIQAFVRLIARSTDAV
jgi:Tfp pilus assembly protein PilO